MTPERYQRIGRFFDEALDLAPEQRAAWLAEACGTDTRLRAEVENLLANHAESEKFLSRPAMDIAAALLAQNQHASLLGQKINHYQILSLLGVGGMGEVYLAEDTQLGRRVALKVLPAELVAKKGPLQRFQQEARAASALNHPNILTIYETGEANGVRFIAAEYVGGETLRECLRRERFMVSETLDIAMQVVAALEAAHQAGIVHRDVKPENVILRKDGLAKLLDFGIAKLAQRPVQHLEAEVPTRALVKTSPGMIMGTVGYMSPEQVRGQAVDGRADEWSLGVMLYEMLTGRLPFAGETVSDAIAAILKTEAEPPTNFNSEIPVELERIVLKTLRKDADERYQHIKDLLLDLRDLKQDLDFGAKLKRTPTQGELTVPKSAGRITAEQISSSARFPNAYTKSTAEYLVGEIRQHKLGFMAAIGIFLLIFAGAGWRFYHSGLGQQNSQQISSLAVLPFENGSGDAELDYLSDGMSESLINKLSQLPQLKVIARNSSFKYRGPNVDLLDVANKLGVQAVVMGKVIKQGDQLAVLVELVDARDNKQLWGEQYNRKLSDALAVQKEIAQTVSERLRPRLSGAQEQQLAKSGTSSPQAYELLLRGKYLNEKSGTEPQIKAKEFYQQAIEADPNYALAYAELATSYSVLATNGHIDPKDGLPKAEAAARKALELDEKLPEGHLALGSIFRKQWKWAEAERELSEAVDLNPNLGAAHRARSRHLSVMGRHDEAVAEASRARELDPLSVTVNAYVSYAYLFARRFDEGIAAARSTLELDPTSDFANSMLGYNYAGKGMYREAIESYKKAVEFGDTSTGTQIYLGAAYAHAGEREKALEILRQLRSSKEYVSPGELPVLLGALGLKDEAFESFERAFAVRDLQLSTIAGDPAFDPLRNDPRFADLVRRVGFPG
ncbi:MAG: protein kinase [Pyrinomonadaceae bacterium]|nr:protein kinase [Pyrinomonadaceae bacterium]